MLFCNSFVRLSDTSWS